MEGENVMNERSLNSRRSFLRLAGLTAAAAATQRSQGAAERPRFEVSSSLYAWDLHDEGIERILDNLQQMAAVNSVYLVGLMHYEKRPLTSPEFPHNPVRKMWQAEDSRVYWHPDMQRYGRIKPRLSDFDWLNQTDWLQTMVEAVRKRGLKTGVELSHTVLDLDRVKAEFMDCVQRNIKGEPQKVFGRAYPICPNNPDARQYVLNLFSELATRYDVDYLQTATLPFMPGGADKGGCFCESCVKTAKEFGFDLVKAKAVLKQNPTAQPELGQWQEFRRASMARYYKVMHDGIHAVRHGADLRFNDCFHSADWGLDFKRLKPDLDSIRVCDYSEQRGDPARMKEKREWLTEERAAVGKGFPIVSAVAVRPKATPELIREGVKIAVECGVQGITLGHYDGAEFPMLRAIREGLVEAKILS
jgi:hypothetical protein